MCGAHQYRKILWGKCSHTGTKMYTHVLIQSDLDLGLTLHHHSWQQHWKLPLNKALSETGENGLVQWKPAKRATLHSYSTFSSMNPLLVTVKTLPGSFLRELAASVPKLQRFLWLGEELTQDIDQQETLGELMFRTQSCEQRTTTYPY